MTFKSAAQLFGDGGANGAIAPVSTSPGAGLGSANRAVAFGEALTAAIANRIGFALALNDENLNTRLASFETTGLDAAYDLGTIASAGGGRVITKDGGAVEAQSAHAVTGDAARDVALFRANALSDTAGVGIGYDFKGRRVGSNAQSGDDPLAGFMDRRILAQSSGNTILVASESAVLNASSTGATRIRLATGGRKFHTGGIGDVIPGYDLIEVTGASTFNGLYLVLSLVGATDTDITVSKLDGTAPSFTADTAATIAVYRPRFSSGGAHSSRVNSGLSAVTAVGELGQLSCVDVVPGGASYAVRVMADGVSTDREIASLDRYGRYTTTVVNADLVTDAAKNAHGGGPAYRHVNDIAGYASSFVAESLDAGASVQGFTALTTRQDAVLTPTLGPTLAFTYTANSAATGELTITTALAANWIYMLVPLGSVLEITGGTAYDGTYVIYRTTTTPRVYVKRLDGTVPSHFPSSGSGSGRWCSISIVGHTSAYAINTDLRGTALKFIQINNLFSTGPSSAGAAIVSTLHSSSADLTELGTNKSYHYVALSPEPSTATTTGGYANMVFCITEDGSVITAGNLTAIGDLAIGGDASVNGTTTVNTLNVNGGVDANSVTVIAGTYEFSPAITFDKYIPVTAWRSMPTGLGGASWTQLLTLNGGAGGDPFHVSWFMNYAGAGDEDVLLFPLTGFLSSGASINTLTVRHSWSAGPAGTILFALWRVDSAGLFTVAEAMNLTVAGSAEHNDTLTVTPAEVMADSSGHAYYATLSPRATAAGGVTVKNFQVNYTRSSIRG